MDADSISRSNSSYIGKVRSNFLGTKFIIYDTQPLHNCSNTSPTGRTSSRFYSKKVSPKVPSGSYNIAQLASLWPSSIMHTDGIKRAIYRAKDRKGLCLSRKDREKIKKKKVLALKAHDAVRNSHEKLLSRHSGSKLISNPDVGAARVTVPSANIAKLENPKQEKAKKLISSSNPNHTEANYQVCYRKRKLSGSLMQKWSRPSSALRSSWLFSRWEK